jgi:hypothetical protein
LRSSDVDPQMDLSAEWDGNVATLVETQGVEDSSETTNNSAVVSDARMDTQSDCVEGGTGSLEGTGQRVTVIVV